jgi:hypothetical protein
MLGFFLILALKIITLIKLLIKEGANNGFRQQGNRSKIQDSES